MPTPTYSITAWEAPLSPLSSPVFSPAIFPSCSGAAGAPESPEGVQLAPVGSILIPGPVQYKAQTQPGQEKQSGCEHCLSFHHTFPFFLGNLGSLPGLSLCFQGVRSCPMKERGLGA